MALKYRPEIDGLRAVAVGAVVLYHAELSLRGVSPFQGGFLGVDVFFVISGYLITSILLREMGEGRFSFKNFYERRARRILPALFSVMLTTLPFAWIYMSPKALREYGISLISAIGFSANFWFWCEDGYTAEPSALKPFLHAWSLAVEEQYYLFFPVLLLVLFKYGKKYILYSFVVIFILSLALAQWMSHEYPSASFYLLPSRGWELLAGSLLAYFEINRGRASQSMAARTLPLLGLASLIFSNVYFKDDMLHPSFLTFVPIVGTCLIVWFCNGRDWVSKLLSTKLFVGVGLISYSFYLWHFPFFAFDKLMMLESSQWMKLAYIVIAFLMSVFSYYVVEQPFRNRQKMPIKPFMAIVGGSFVGLMSVSFYVYLKEGVPSRQGELGNYFSAAVRRNVYQDERNCHTRALDEVCEFLLPDAKSTVITVGDSHADVLGYDLHNWTLKKGFSFVHMPQSACPFVMGAYRYDEKALKKSCDPEFQKKWFEKIKSYKNPIVVYATRLPIYLSGERFDNTVGGVEYGVRTFLSATNTPNNITDPSKLIEQTLIQLSQAVERLILVYPVPEMGWNVPNKVRSLINKYPVSERSEEFLKVSLDIPLKAVKQRQQRSYEIYDRVKASNLVRVYPRDLVCSEESQKCSGKAEEKIFYEDDNHVSPHISGLIVKEIDRLF